MDEYIQQRLHMLGGKKLSKAKNEKVEHLKEKLLEKIMQVIKGGAKPRAIPKAKSVARPKQKVSASAKARGGLVKKLMRGHGFSLPEASKYIKQHNLKY